MASAMPGASRSMTDRVASGVRSFGENPVPPVVTTSPANDDDRSVRAAATGSTPSGTTRRSTTRKPWRASDAASSSPERSSRVPRLTDSETVSTLASSVTAATLSPDTAHAGTDPGAAEPGAIMARWAGPTRPSRKAWPNGSRLSRCSSCRRLLSPPTAW